MELINITHNDDLRSVANKCNINFKQIGTTLANLLKRQNMVERGVTNDTINQAVTTLTTVTIPNEVTTQIVAADIPGQISTEVASQIGTDYTNVVSDFITIDANDVVVVNGMAHRWGKIAKISLTYRFKNPYVVMSDGKINNLQLGTLTSDWMTVGGLTNVSLDTTRQVEGVIDASGLVAFMSANSRGTSYTIDENAVMYAGFMYMLA